jgi:replication factor C subunit 2/4
MLKDC